jgi:hypothetical protein
MAAQARYPLPAEELVDLGAGQLSRCSAASLGNVHDRLSVDMLKLW